MMPYQNQNPSYYQQYLQPQYPYQNPYMDRINQLQQYQQGLQQPQQMQIQPQPQNQFATLGKFVESIDMVKATDIPMDGNMYYFPKADGTEIYGKRWTSSGTTETISYKPYFENKEQHPSVTMSDELKLQMGAFGEVLGVIQNELKILSDKVDKIKPSRQKGAVDNE